MASKHVMSHQEFIAAGGKVCPGPEDHKNEKVLHQLKLSDDGSWLDVEAECSVCHLKWTEVYVLVSYDQAPALQHDTKGAKFLRSLQWSLPFVWFDSEGLLDLNEILLLKVELHATTTREEYNGFKATIINKITGVVESKVFLFDDYLVTRSQTFLVIPSARWGWYRDTPASTVSLCLAIEQWALMFRN